MNYKDVELWSVAAACPPEGRCTRKHSQASINAGVEDKEGLDSDVMCHAASQRWESSPSFPEDGMDLTEAVGAGNPAP